MITTVIFDMDDTLYDEIDYCRSGFRAVGEYVSAGLGTVCGDEVFEALWGQFNSGDRCKVFNNALSELNIDYDEGFIASLVKVYREHEPEIVLPEESREVLCRLGEKYSLGLLTDGFLPGQQLKVRSLEIEKYFGIIVYTEELGRQFWKPSPIGFEKILMVLNAKAEKSVYVADNAKKDFIAPNKLGMASIQLVRDAAIHTGRSEDPDGAAGHVIHKITQLPDLLEKI